MRFLNAPFSKRSFFLGDLSVLLKRLLRKSDASSANPVLEKDPVFVGFFYDTMKCHTVSRLGRVSLMFSLNWIHND